MKQYARAIDDYTATFRLNPGFAGIVATRGYTYFLNGEYDKALADFDQANQIDPKHGWAYRNRAMLLATCPDDQKRNGASEREQLEMAQQLMRPAADVYEAQAAVAAENGDFDEAVRRQQQVLEDPSWRLNPDMQARLEVYRSKQPYREGMAVAATAPKVPVAPADSTANVKRRPIPEKPSAASTSSSDMELLKGTWVCVVTTKDGEAVEDYVGVRAVIEGDSLTWFFPQENGKYREQKNRFRIDPTRNPKHFDSWPIDKPELLDERIYSVSENMLRWATNLDGKTRPESIDTGRWQFTMKRVVAGAKGP